MKRLLKWAGYGLAGLVGLVGLVLLVVSGAFGASEAILRWPVEEPAVQLVASSDPGAVARGKRVATLNGCHDCHGKDLQGQLFHDEMPIIRAWGPNLSRMLAEQSDADFDRAIRHGVAADGRRLWVMPSAAFSQLTDQEAADLMAYLRTFKPTGEVQPRLQVGHIGRLGVLLGKFSSEPAMLKTLGRPNLEDLGPQYVKGRDVARLCVECHGSDLKGNEMLKSPDLTMAASYDPEDFERLLRTGIAAGNRKLGLMTVVSPARFNILSSDEISALHGYLKARASRTFAEAEATAGAVQQP